MRKNSEEIKIYICDRSYGSDLKRKVGEKDVLYKMWKTNFG